jgi:hypothetical protein
LINARRCFVFFNLAFQREADNGTIGELAIVYDLLEYQGVYFLKKTDYNANHKKGAVIINRVSALM